MAGHRGYAVIFFALDEFPADNFVFYRYSVRTGNTVFAAAGGSYADTFSVFAAVEQKSGKNQPVGSRNCFIKK